MMLLQGFCVFLCKEIVDHGSLKCRKVHLHSCEPFNWDHRSTDMWLSWIVVVCSIFFEVIFIIMITYSFQGNKEVLYQMIQMEGATPLFSKEVVLHQRTGMIGTATATDDEEVLVILRSMKSAVNHFVGNKKYFSA